MYSHTVSMLVNVSLVLGLITISLYVAKLKIKKQNKNNHIKLISAFSLGQKEKLILVEVNATHLLIGVTANGLRTLHSYTPDTEDEAESIKPFSTHLSETNLINVLKGQVS